MVPVTGPDLLTRTYRPMNPNVPAFDGIILKINNFEASFSSGSRNINYSYLRNTKVYYLTILSVILRSRGRKPPPGKLVVDKVIPVYKGGDFSYTK